MKDMPFNQRNDSHRTYPYCKSTARQGMKQKPISTTYSEEDLERDPETDQGEELEPKGDLERIPDLHLEPVLDHHQDLHQGTHPEVIRKYMQYPLAATNLIIMIRQFPKEVTKVQ